MAAEINNIPHKIYLSEDEMPKAWYSSFVKGADIYATCYLGS